ncbi:MAG: hypothetical protein IKR86_07735 [Candidatus Methanomethylophilaceae archaeon]|nr:hypothetical protein [Candidatus Methanomethylophilaceae archaeon]
MLKDDRGITAFVDAIAFMAILVIAIAALSVHYGFDEENGPNASEVLDAVSSSKARLSDLTSMEDDAVVYVTDILAYSVHTGDSEATDYLEKLLDAHCRGHPYSVVLEFGEEKKTIGEEVRVRSGASGDYPVSSGGSIRITLSIGQRCPSCAPRSCPLSWT